MRIFRAIEQKSLDVRFQLRGKRDPGSEIVIVAIDENSIGKLGWYPWPRRYIAQFVDKITDAKARLLALDVMYAERQNVDILEAFDSLAEKFNNLQLWNHLSAGPEKEELLTALHKKKTRFDEDSKIMYRKFLSCFWFPVTGIKYFSLYPLS